MEKMKEKLSRCTKKEKKDIFKEPKKISKNNIKEVTYGKVFQLSNLMIYGSSRHHRTETLSTASVLLFWKEICCQGAMPTTTGVRKEKSFRESLVRNQVVVPSFQKQQNRYGHSSRTNSTCSESSNCKKKVFIFFLLFLLWEKKISTTFTWCWSQALSFVSNYQYKPFIFPNRQQNPMKSESANNAELRHTSEARKTFFSTMRNCWFLDLETVNKKKIHLMGKASTSSNSSQILMQASCKKKKKKIVILLKQQPSRINQQKITSLTRII